MLTDRPDLTPLQSPIAPASPSGEDLRYRDDYVELERLARMRSEQQFGDTVYEAIEPNWDELTTHAIALAQQTHDLRVGVSLTQGLLRTSGMGGFADGLSLLESWLTTEWDTLHPELDPDDGTEAIERSNVLFGLCDYHGTIVGLQQTPLAAGRGIGECGWQEIHDAQEREYQPEKDSRYGIHEIHAIFMAADFDTLLELRRDVERAGASIAAISDVFFERTGAALNLDPVADIIGEILSAIVEFTPEATSAEPKRPDEQKSLNGPPAETPMPESADDPPIPIDLNAESFEVTNREDVVRILDAICRYYDKCEPSSPVPLILRRTSKLVTMDFIDIVRNLAPDGLADISRWVEGAASGDQT